MRAIGTGPAACTDVSCTVSEASGAGTGGASDVAAVGVASVVEDTGGTISGAGSCGVASDIDADVTAPNADTGGEVVADTAGEPGPCSSGGDGFRTVAVGC